MPAGRQARHARVRLLFQLAAGVLGGDQPPVQQRDIILGVAVGGGVLGEGLVAEVLRVILRQLALVGVLLVMIRIALLVVSLEDDLGVGQG